MDKTVDELAAELLENSIKPWIVPDEPDGLVELMETQWENREVSNDQHGVFVASLPGAIEEPPWVAESMCLPISDVEQLIGNDWMRVDEAAAAELVVSYREIETA